MTPDPDTNLAYAWTSTRLPLPSLAIAAVVHRKFVKTHTIPQTPQSQEISIFLLKPVLLEISQPSSTESHYFWNAFVNIYCRGFLNDNGHRLWLSLIWQFANLTPFCLLARWSKGKFFSVFQHHHCGWLQNMLQNVSWRCPCAWHSSTLEPRALLVIVEKYSTFAQHPALTNLQHKGRLTCV